MTIHDNRCRVRNASCALPAYHAVAHIRNHKESLSDLISDLGHYADRHKIDFVECCTLAIGAWAVERRGNDADVKMPSVVIQIREAP